MTEDAGMKRALGELIARVESTSDAMDRADASGWLVVCIDVETLEHDETDCVVACYGPYDTPEEALVEAGRHQQSSLDQTHLAEPGEAGWLHFVKPLFPPVKWREKQ